MSYLKPIKTSTPVLVPHVQGRHSYKQSIIFSPIENMKNAEKAISEKSRLEPDGSIRTCDDKQNLRLPESARYRKKDSPSVIPNEIIPENHKYREKEDFSEDNSLETSDSSANNSDTEIEDKNGERSPQQQRSAESFLAYDTSEYHGQDKNRERSPCQQRSAESSFAYDISGYQYGLLILILGIIGVVLALNSNDSALSTVTINTLKESFPQQDEEFWTFIKSGVMEINNFEKPTVIILMHKKGVTEISELLNNITTYASCVINTNCLIDPVILKGKDLNTPELIEDYGILIDNYRSLLEEKHILVVTNLEDVQGSVAQAFHYFCDEYTPLVKKSLILFTLQVTEYKGKELEQAVNILNRRWKDIDPDKLQPLITRVSSIVLRIK